MKFTDFISVGRGRLVLVGLFVLFAANPATAGLVTFESVASGTLYGDGGVAYSLTEDGITLTSDAMWVFGPSNGCGGGGCLTNGTNVGVIYRVSLTASPVFNLNSLDYSRTGSDWGYTTLYITGDILGGGTYTSTLALDADDGFQTASLNWINLTSVHMSGSGATGTSSYFTVDNIDVSAVPDAGSSLLLLGMGLFGVRACRRRRQ